MYAYTQTCNQRPCGQTEHPWKLEEPKRANASRAYLPQIHRRVSSKPVLCLSRPLDHLRDSEVACGSTQDCKTKKSPSSARLLGQSLQDAVSGVETRWRLAGAIGGSANNRTLRRRQESRGDDTPQHEPKASLSASSHVRCRGAEFDGALAQFALARALGSLGLHPHLQAGGGSGFRLSPPPLGASEQPPTIQRCVKLPAKTGSFHSARSSLVATF